MFRVTSRLRFIEPQLASPVDQPPEGKHWIHEIKHDGYRSQVVIERGQVRVFSRNGYDWSDRYSGIVRRAREGHAVRCFQVSVPEQLKVVGPKLSLKVVSAKLSTSQNFAPSQGVCQEAAQPALSSRPTTLRHDGLKLIGLS